MGLSPSHYEVEIKLPVPGAEQALALLQSHGFRLAKTRALEKNVIFDREGELRAQARLLRVREVEGRAVLTFKGPATPGRHKSREELEVDVANADVVRTILSRLGFAPGFRYEKFRTEFTDETGVAMVDETPIGVFLELEGPPAWIDRTARALGYAESDYITASYLALYFDYCRERGIPAADMVFAL
jgi:adenylate cyclase class 2